MKVIIAGGRDFNDAIKLGNALYHFQKEYGRITEVVCGMCKGADMLGKKWAEFMNIPVVPFPADWNKYGKSAGPIRNKQMAEYADALVAFWDRKSSGTGDMIEQADTHKLRIVIVEY